MDTPLIQNFISRWQKSGAAERANYALFLTELCDVLDVPHPEPTQPDDTANAYVFERSVTFQHLDGSNSTGRIDLYKRGCFILEAKQGVEKREKAEALAAVTQAKAKSAKKGTATRGSAAWDEAMLKAHGQAQQYVRAMPASEGRPPFLVIVDVGHCIDLYSEFTRTGGAYTPFPHAPAHRILLADLAKLEVRRDLALVWTDPLALDPSRRSAKVTREIAEKLGSLAQSLERSGHRPEAVAAFLMRALFTMFAEDVLLLPKNSFLHLLQSRVGRLETFVPKVEELWERMNLGGFSNALDQHVRRFNGNLFAEARALPLNEDQLELLIEAATKDWCDVEPAIFGTLLERALNPVERHKLGAHYTPRAYVERLVIPTVVEPLRAEWDAAKAAAVTLDRAGQRTEAIAEVQRYHRRLCEVRILDPACGSGNFLYVTLEHLKRLEGEVLAALDELGHEQAVLEMESFAVLPRQLLGIEVNPRAAAIAELVLWIGHLQWHFRTRGKVQPPEPIITAFHNIECRDAVLAWDATEPVLDDGGQPVTRWDGRTTKVNPVTWEEVPDESVRVPVLRYLNPRKAEWPAAEFVVGNPPFIGTKRMRAALGHDYVEALRLTYSEHLEDNADFVMIWWHKAAALVQSGTLRRFGFITTNSITQSFNRRVLAYWLSKDVKIVFAVPDHPWVDGESAAAVRIAMTVCALNKGQICTRIEVVSEVGSEDHPEEFDLRLFVEKADAIHADLRVGSDITKAVPLIANGRISGMGVALHGAGFIVEPELASKLREQGASIIKPYLGGSDLVREKRERYVIDFSFLSENAAREANPAAMQHVIDHVRPERVVNRRDAIRTLWWRFGWERPGIRAAFKGTSRFIATTETAKHRVFQFVDTAILPDHMIVAIALDDIYFLGVLSSRVHVTWALASGGTLEDRPRYNKSVCFEPFPFAAATETQKARIRETTESLDTHRKHRQALHPKLTLTDMYNVLEKLRAATPLNAKEQIIHEQGLVSLLRQIHDDLDAAVAEAYGWPATLSDEELLTRLVALNAERAAEERRGLIRWLRPEFQDAAGSSTQTTLDTDTATEAAAPAAKAGKRPWPKALAEQAQAVRAQLTLLGTAATPASIAATFKGARADRVEDLLETLASLGQARMLSDGSFMAQ